MRGIIIVCVGIVLIALIGIMSYHYVGARQRAEEARLRVHSIARVKWLVTAVAEHEKMHNSYPETLGELEPLFGEKKGGRNLQMSYSMLVSVAGPISFGDVLANPLTGDSPGYEYVKPAANSDHAVIYQLEQGKRAKARPMGYLDGSVK